MSSDSGQNGLIFIDLVRHRLISQASAVIQGSLSFHLCDRIKLNHGLLIINGTYFLSLYSFKELLKVQRVAEKPHDTMWCWAIKW